MSKKLKCKTVFHVTRFLFKSFLDELTFSLSFSAHHLFFLVRECPNTFTCKKRIEDDFCSCFCSGKNLFCSESNEIGPVGSKGNLASQLKLTVLAVHLKISLKSGTMSLVKVTLIFFPTLSHTRRLLSCTVCEHSGFIVKKTSCKIQ